MADVYCDYLNGSDATGTGASGAPYKTAGYACGHMAGGDRLIILATATQVINVNTSNVSNGYLTPPAGVAGSPTVVEGRSAAGGSLDAVNDFTGFPLLQRAAVAITQILNCANTLASARNLVIDGGGNTTYGVYGNGSSGTFANLKVTGCTYGAFAGGLGTQFLRSLLTANATGCYFYTYSCMLYGSVVTGNTTAGVNYTGPCAVVRCLIYGNTGAATDGLFLASGSSGIALANAIHGNGRDGVRMDDAGAAAVIQGNVIGGNAGYNLRGTVTDWSALPQLPGINRNFFYASTSGNYSKLPAGPNDVLLTGNPFTNAAAGDFSLNAAAGAGAGVRAAGWPGVFPGGLTTGYPDGGAAQHQDSGGGGGGGGVGRLVGGGLVW